MRDLASDSDLMRRVGDAPLPDLVELTTIGSATDVIVPGTAADRPGARGTTVIPHALDAHAAVVTDPDALAGVRAALEDRPMPCRTLLTSVAGEVVPALVTDLEIGAGGVLGTLGRVADQRGERPGRRHFPAPPRARAPAGSGEVAATLPSRPLALYVMTKHVREPEVAAARNRSRRSRGRKTEPREARPWPS